MMIRCYACDAHDAKQTTTHTFDGCDMDCPQCGKYRIGKSLMQSDEILARINHDALSAYLKRKSSLGSITTLYTHNIDAFLEAELA
jgi:hypothetical protein